MEWLTIDQKELKVVCMHVCEWMVYYVVYCFTELDTMLGDTQLEIVGKISLECIALYS